MPKLLALLLICLSLFLPSYANQNVEVGEVKMQHRSAEEETPSEPKASARIQNAETEASEHVGEVDDKQDGNGETDESVDQRHFYRPVNHLPTFNYGVPAPIGGGQHQYYQQSSYGYYNNYGVGQGYPNSPIYGGHHYGYNVNPDYNRLSYGANGIPYVAFQSLGPNGRPAVTYLSPNFGFYYRSRDGVIGQELRDGEEEIAETPEDAIKFIE